MDWLTFTSNILKFTSDIVGSLAWPTLVLFLLWRFRDAIELLLGEIKPLVHKLTSVKVGAVEAKFALDTEKALGDIQATPTHIAMATPVEAQLELPEIPLPEAIGPPMRAGTEQHTIVDAPDLGSFDTRVEDDWPSTLDRSSVGEDATTLRNSALVAMAWRDVEGAIDKLAKAINHRFPHNKLHVNSKLKAIEASALLEPRFVSALKALQKLRNEVIHSPGFEPTDESAKKYLEGARQAQNVLKDAAFEALSNPDRWG